MTVFYSAAHNGFFDDMLVRELPEDAVILTATQHEELLAAQSQGLRIGVGDDGNPRAAAAPFDPAAFIELVRARRNSLLAASDAMMLGDRPLTANQREAWTAYRQALRDLPASVQIRKGATEPPEVRYPTPPAR